ncbi:MAG TPA: glycine zipper 2TM domain-containing protein [Ottowia sp.]|nr:glycine zipper 2TM domain-containing protein [Burkholderiales bacterium]TXI18825.1 MAG: glycine zipper 2TM domain-containing protein [Ottowia sp.]HOZ93891.1 glycine zipper 2TM domain-containing protein [Ottowia sp.]HQO52962.1 glycine zipper 2TM domain-containing protein [Ottowia sp.]
MHLSQRFVRSLATAAAALTLAACAQHGGYPQGNYPGSYPGSYPGNQAYSQFGRVTNVEYVRGGQSQGVAGAVIGGAVGGLAGSQVGGGSGRTAATVAGVIGGALIGNMLERNMDRNRVEHYRVTVQFDNGGVRQFEYAQHPNVQIGDRVRAEGDQLYR